MRYLLSFIIGIILLSACTQHKKIVYLQDKLAQDSTSSFITKQPIYHLKAGDVLYINVASINQEVVNAFNINSTSGFTGTYFSDASLYINGYSINDSGYVDIPVIDTVYVMGMTITQAQLAIQKKIDEYLKDATAVVKLLSYKITMIGEVSRPGVYNNYNDNITVLEALAMAGDITSYGDKKRILVVRPTEKGTESFRLDLTDISILGEEGFHLIPNDIVYVQPVRTKAFRLNSPNISIVLSMITTTILVINFITR